MHVREELKRKYPTAWAKRNKSRECAIRLFCLECVGVNISEVKQCTDKTCPLYTWRMKTSTLKSYDPHFKDTCDQLESTNDGELISEDPEAKQTP